MSLTLQVHPGEYAVCRLEPAAPLPAWLPAGGFTSVTRTPDELSVVCPAAAVPAGLPHEAGWSLVGLVGPFPFSAVGILASVAAPLAEAGVSMLPIATFDTDYLLVKTARLGAATAALREAGHVVRGS